MTAGDQRENIDIYFARLARQVASRSTCPRRHVGAVLVKDKYLRGTGYNGAPGGVRDCFDEGCLMREGHCVRTVHAEANVILQSDFEERQGATIYTTDMPCWDCAKLIVNSGISRIVFERDYPRHRSQAENLCGQKNVVLEQILLPGPALVEIDDFADVKSVPFE